MINGALLRDMFITGAALLEKNKAHIDSLNVFPVPDGDTGTNMSMTMQGTIKELKESDATTVSGVAQAAAFGALKGARGNSGVILSQIFRGFSRTLAEADEMDANMFAMALNMGTVAAYKAVMKPREGTMLTVSRMMSEAALAAAEENANIYKLLDIIIETGEVALAMTPELLPVLKEAGVVDSGGKGLLLLLRGFKMAIDGEEVDDYVIEAQSEGLDDDEAAILDELEDIKLCYCTEFFITHLDESFTEVELSKFREKLNRLGDSVVVAHDSGIVKVHVHSNCPGKVLQLALRLGELDQLKLDNMRQQNRDLVENLKKNEKENAIVAVSSGKGIEATFKELGVAVSIEGGQTMNPSIDKISRAIRRANARNIFILPNNPNIILAAQEAAKLSERNVHVIPTKTMMQGIAAAVAFVEDANPNEVARRMENAMNDVVSGALTYAVRDTRFNGTSITKGDIIGLLNNDIVEVGSSVDETALALVRRMLALKDEDAVVSIFYGENMDEDNAAALVSALEQEYEDAEFTIQNGGQPLYYYYFSVE